MQNTTLDQRSYKIHNHGLSHYFIGEQHKLPFNSEFLVQYDTHFSTIQQIYAKNEMFKLLQSTMPDVSFTRNKDQKSLLLKSPSEFYRKQADEMIDRSVGHLTKTSVKPATVLKLLHRFRYLRNRSTSKTLHIFMDQKFSGSGYIRAGRYAHNFRRNVRYGAFVRHSVFSLYLGATSAFQRHDSGAAAFLGHYPQFLSSGLRARPSAFLTRTSLRPLQFRRGFRQKLLVVMLSAIYALRSVWLRTSEELHRRPLVRMTHGVMGHAAWRHHEMIRFGFRNYGFRFKVAQFMASSTPGTPDFNRQESLAHKKKNLKHHARRIGFGWYEKKLWGYDKTYKYWRYMKWVAHFYFRGLAYHRLFYMRLDVFLVYHLRVRNIRHARLLISGGHAFIGDAACLHANQPIEPMTVVSVSRYARKWLAFFYNRFRALRKNRAKSGLLVFGRYFENAYIYGPRYSFAIPYGDPLDVLWAKRAGKSGFFAFSYYQGQKMVSSAWW